MRGCPVAVDGRLRRRPGREVGHTNAMSISRKRRLFGGTKLTFKCPTCGAKMPITPAALQGGNKVACRSCAKIQVLSSADAALLAAH